MTLEQHAPQIPVFERRLGSWQIAVSRDGYGTEQLRAAYDACAPRWDRKIGRLGFPVAYREVVRHAALGLTAEDETPVRVLDCGVGTGAMSLALAGEMSEAFDLSAVDISPVMLEEASANLRRAGIGCRADLADISALPYASESFDFVMCAHALEHLADPETALADMCRVLKPGGRFLLVTTRKSVFGAFVQLKWRTHRFDAAMVHRQLQHQGLEELTALQVGSGRWTRFWSTAVVGRKPAIHEIGASGDVEHAA
ncbi:class I SAM-dependent methyltransferase [Roseibium sp. MMSF_3412]|uniref:class I SAM-dependent methyltransferase n=1 Tax=Roseibium sp. MMSF_3412 TaxID=3046712 RepID=UPI00273F5915|nr:class I SAM-dependent methyltransferase [Roseibium sp. MMSF_3412]